MTGFWTLPLVNCTLTALAKRGNIMIDFDLDNLNEEDVYNALALTAMRAKL